MKSCHYLECWVGSLLSLMLLLVCAAVTSVADAKMCLAIAAIFGRSQWLGGLRRRSAAARLLRLWVGIPPGAWMFFCCECCVWSGRGLCDELITLREESYRLWCVVVCDLETSWMGRPWPTGICRVKNIHAYQFWLILRYFFSRHSLWRRLTSQNRRVWGCKQRTQYWQMCWKIRPIRIR